MDISYATIIVYGGEHLRMYREVRFVNTIYNANQVVNHPIYAIDQDLGCLILVSNDQCNPQSRIEDTINLPQCSKNDVWKLYFGGAFSKVGAGFGIFFISLEKKNIIQSFKLYFESH